MNRLRLRRIGPETGIYADRYEDMIMGRKKNRLRAMAKGATQG